MDEHSVGGVDEGLGYGGGRRGIEQGADGSKLVDNLLAEIGAGGKVFDELVDIGLGALDFFGYLSQCGVELDGFGFGGFFVEGAVDDLLQKIPGKLDAFSKIGL